MMIFCMTKIEAVIEQAQVSDIGASYKKVISTDPQVYNVFYQPGYEEEHPDIV